MQESLLFGSELTIPARCMTGRTQQGFIADEYGDKMRKDNDDGMGKEEG